MTCGVGTRILHQEHLLQLQVRVWVWREGMGGLQQVEEACWAVIKRWQFSVPTVGEYVVQLYR